MKLHGQQKVPVLLAGLIALCVLLALGGCRSGPEPVYEGPGGSGRFRYDPVAGIVREGSKPTAGEQKLFESAQRAFNERRFVEAIGYCEQITLSFPDGARAVDAILLRMNARIEGSRGEDSTGLPNSVALSDWLFLYLTPSYDPRFQGFMAQGGENAATVNRLRARPFDDFIGVLAPDADAIADNRQLNPLVRDLRLLVTYYIPAMDVKDYRLRTAEIGRNIAWIAYAARDFDYCLDAAAELSVLNPPPGIKADGLFVEGKSLLRNGAYPLAASTFERLFRSGNLRDTDTPWRPYALYELIVATSRMAKGPEFDIAIYEKCLELFGDYELYLLENASVPKALRERFRELIATIYQVFIDRDLLAARTYRRIGERRSADYYEKHAEEWRKQLDQRLKADAARQ